MIPKSLSASALQVASLCLARYHAENILRAERPANKAASLGTAVHTALEWYVKAVHLEKTREPDLKWLLDLFKMAYCSEFDTVEPTADEMYHDGVKMLRGWFARTSFENKEVISCEIKTSFDVKTSAGPIPFNYIWDRFDKRLDESDTYEVVDYKTIRAYLSPEDLHGKIQARIYGLAAQIQVPTAEKIWVRFDLLRHDVSVGTVFTRAQNVATWNWLKASAERILAASPDDLVETLNPECNFCVRKISCEKLKSNISGGGIHSVADTQEMVAKRAKLEWQVKGLKAAMEELDDLLLSKAAEEDTLEFESDIATAFVKAKTSRSVDPERVSHIVPLDVFKSHGGHGMGIKDFMALLKDPRITDSQRMQLESQVTYKQGNPYIMTKAKSAIEDE